MLGGSQGQRSRRRLEGYHVARVGGQSGDREVMTTRVYLQAVQMMPGPPVDGDVPAERVFIHASDPP